VIAGRLCMLASCSKHTGCGFQASWAQMHVLFLAKEHCTELNIQLQGWNGLCSINASPFIHPAIALICPNIKCLVLNSPSSILSSFATATHSNTTCLQSKGHKRSNSGWYDERRIDRATGKQTLRAFLLIALACAHLVAQYGI